MKLVYYILFGLMGLGALAGLVSLFRARRTIEKVVSLDVLTTLITGAMLVIALVSGSVLLIDIALVYAVLSFGAVLVVARYREGGF